MPQTLPINEIHDIIIDALRRFFNNCGVKRAVLGLSGGIDSAVVATLATEALGNENIHGLLMPSQFSTLHSISDAVDLADNLDIKYDIISIEKLYHRFMIDLYPVFEGSYRWDNTQENIQARIRGTIVMAYSNRHGALALNTSNKSELAAGYGTLYGDLAGSLMVIADIYKTEVYELAHYLNQDKILIPLNTIAKAPSAELREDQKDSDTLPEYPILDSVLFKLIECKMSVDEIVNEGMERGMVERIAALRAKSAFKRFQMPQIIKVSNSPLLDESKWV